MPKKRDTEKPIVKDDPSRIMPTTMEDVMHASMMPYAEHVILERALPRAEDGLKPVQRRILYTMMELGTTPDKPHRKCARIVGDCLGKYHPHGDSSVYGALVHMAQDFSMRATLVDGHGNFGSIDGDSAAAMRYTEARMTPLALQMLRDIEKDTVPFRLNFDDSLKEPDLLPSRYPNLLVNGAGGIAVGLATNIPPHNFGEATRAVIAQIENPDITLDELMKIIPGPDFPTGGVIVDNEEIRRGYETGRGKLQVRARIHMEEGTAGRKLLVITEIPYEVNKAAMLAKIQQLTEEKKAQLGMIYEIRDESDREGMRAVIELKKEADPDKILAALYKYSDLQVTFGVNLVAIADGKPVQLTLKSMIDYYIRHQKNVVTRRTRFELEQARARAHILQGLMIAVDNLDEVIRLIRASKTPKEARQRLMEAFDLDEIQAQAILDMRLQRLTNLEILALRKEYDELLKTIDRLEGILKSEKKLMGVIRKELTEICEEHGDARRTTIQKVEEAPVLPEEEGPVPEDTVVAFTRGGYLKRMYPANVKKTPLPTAAEDQSAAARWCFNTLTDRTLMIFTNRGNLFQLNVGKLNESKPRDRGQQLSALLVGLEDGEQAVYMDCVIPAQLDKAPDFLFVTRNGIVKRTAAAEYNIRTKKAAAINLKDGDELLTVLPLQPDKDILLLTRLGAAIRFPQDTVSTQGRTASGVKGMALEAGDSLLMADQMNTASELLLITDRGYGKRLPSIELQKQNRGGKGAHVITFARTATNGRTIAAAVVCDSHETPLLITQATSAPTPITSFSVKPMKRFEKGTPLVMALMEDVVTDMIRP